MIQKHDLTARVTELVRIHLEDYPTQAAIDSITLFTQLGFDWLAIIELVLELEEEFMIIINDEDIEHFINIQSVVSYLKRVS